LLRYFLATLLLFLFLTAPAVACPKKRPGVKTLSDRSAASIPADAEKTTFLWLAQQSRPSEEAIGKDERIPPIENKIFHLRAVLTAIDQEPDGDLKLHLRSEADPKAKMVAEVPQVGCVPARYQARIKKLRNQLNALARSLPKTVELQGVGYWGYVREDETTPNGVQLHPLLQMRVIPQGAAPHASAP